MGGSCAAVGAFRTIQGPKSREAAPWAFRDAEDFRQAVFRAVNWVMTLTRRGRSVSNWPESGIPADWRNCLDVRPARGHTRPASGADLVMPGTEWPLT